MFLLLLMALVFTEKFLPEICIPRRKYGKELVHRDSQLQIPPRHKELQHVLLHFFGFPLYKPEITWNSFFSFCPSSHRSLYHSIKLCSEKKMKFKMHCKHGWLILEQRNQ